MTHTGLLLALVAFICVTMSSLFSSLQSLQNLLQFLRNRQTCRLIFCGSRLSWLSCRLFWRCTYLGTVVGKQTVMLLQIGSEKTIAVLSPLTFHFSHRDRLLSKLQSLAFESRSGDSPQPQPSAPAYPEGQALVTLGPRCHKERPEDEEENEEQHFNESNQTMHFNNTSYFFPPTEAYSGEEK